MTSHAPKRPPWIRPTVQEAGTINITERDVQILVYLQYYGQLRTSYLCELMGLTPTIEQRGGKDYTVYRQWKQRHRKLWAHGYINELCYSHHREHIIQLDKEGIEFLKHRGLYVEGFEKFRKDFSQSDAQLAHRLASAEKVAELEIYARKHGIKFVPRHQLSHNYMMTLQNGEKVIPDDICRLDYPNGLQRGILIESETANKDVRPSKNKKTSIIGTLQGHRIALNEKAYTQFNMPMALVLCIFPHIRKDTLDNTIAMMGETDPTTGKPYITGTSPFLFTSHIFFDRRDMYAEAPKPKENWVWTTATGEFDLLKA